MTFLLPVYAKMMILMRCLFYRDAIVTWLKKKIGPGLHNITTVEEAERILTDEDKIVLGYLDSLVVITAMVFYGRNMLVLSLCF